MLSDLSDVVQHKQADLFINRNDLLPDSTFSHVCFEENTPLLASFLLCSLQLGSFPPYRLLTRNASLLFVFCPGNSVYEPEGDTYCNRAARNSFSFERG